MAAFKKAIDLVPSNLEFGVFTGSEIKKMSVVKIITGLTYDLLGHALPGGLYDSAMGTYGKALDTCTTCLSRTFCPGHMGHIELNALVYNPFFIKLIYEILKIFCLSCFKIQIKERVLEIIILQLQLVDAGYVVEALELEIYKSDIVYHSCKTLIKNEDGTHIHPEIARMRALLDKKTTAQDQTKTSCAIRTMLINVALQKPTTKKCIHCLQTFKKLTYQYRNILLRVGKGDLNERTQGDTGTLASHNKVLLAEICRKYVREIYKNYSTFLQLLFPLLRTAATDIESPVDIFFMDTIAVTPPKARPSNVLLNQIVEHPQTAIYRNVIEANSILRMIMMHIKNEGKNMKPEMLSLYETAKGSTPHGKMYYAWQDLQTAVDLLLDANLSKVSPIDQALKQVLEKKDGLIRKHLMGKRVNYAARTVITPDPNINVEEVGISDIFARKLSYPVPVTPWNVTDLRKMVINGPDVHPGANYIEDEKGITVLIPNDNRAKRESMAKLLLTAEGKGTKIVHRHVINGDVLLLNRQPSLHKPSIMAHKARILRGEKTFRLHYSNCKAYNADFDGDEMNAHLPQNEVSRAEAYNLANVASNYLVPKDGTPLGGLIQDHVISGVKLSIRGRFFNKEDYQQMVFQGLSHIRSNIKLLPPTILKPIALWSGKQIISTILINLIPKGYPPINLTSTAKIAAKKWEVANQHAYTSGGTPLKGTDMSESEVIIHQGELLCGVLDKQQYGATQYGLVHCMYELYGGDTSTRLLTSLTKIFTSFLQREGFTLGVQDILLTETAEANRRAIIKESRGVGNLASSHALELPDVPAHDILANKLEEAYSKDPKFRVILDRKYKTILDQYTNDINKVCLPDGLISRFPSNNLQLMVLSGAKGSLVNTMQISCLLGQIELEGKRPPLMISGKSLPSFASFETSPKSGGFIDGRFLTGIQPQDFFFHCMAGREGLIDTAVKTSRSGYLQRCLIKHLEGLNVGYDLTVRDSDNCVVQFLYGEDGMDILKSKYFNIHCMKFLDNNASVILQKKELNTVKDESTIIPVQKYAKKLKSWNKKNAKHPIKRHLSSFTRFSGELQQQVEVENPNEINKNTGRTKLNEAIIKLWKKADANQKEKYDKKCGRCPDPTLSRFQPDRFYGSVSEYVDGLIRSYGETNPLRKDTMSDILYMKSLKALAAPGEPVGLLAAQSIGEPSTQMTLNTFHFAGRGEMNVTLGIPRLREILMLASSNIKTPSMDTPVTANKEQEADKLRISLNRVTLADILEYVNVKSCLILRPERAYQYKLHFQFLPRQAYKNDFCVKPKKVLKMMANNFFKLLFRAIVRSSRGKGNEITTDTDGQKGSSKYNKPEDNDDDDEPNDVPAEPQEKQIELDSSDEEIVNDDDDATGIKLKAKKQDEAEYDDPEAGEELQDANEEEEQDEGSVADPKDPLDDLNDDEAATQVLLNNQMVSDYIYDQKEHLWCTMTFNLPLRYRKPDLSNLIRKLAEKFILHEVHNIKRAITYRIDKDLMLKTDGINIVEMFKHDKILDVNRIYSNDIHAIANTYGIEAAAKVIVKEVQNVFKVYGIIVDPRHLLLIADYMTFDGTFKPLSRKGIEHSSSPLQQMSFESCLQFLRQAIVFGRNDSLSSPSSRLMVGLPVKNGTGSFDLKWDMHKAH